MQDFATNIAQPSYKITNTYPENLFLIVCNIRELTCNETS